MLLIEPLAAAIVELRPGRKADATDDAWLVYPQVFGILVDRAVMTPSREAAEVARVVDYSLRALMGQGRSGTAHEAEGVVEQVQRTESFWP